MDCDYLMDLSFKESYKLNAYDGKTIKRHPRLRCLKTERDTDLNIYTSSILVSIPTITIYRTIAV